MILICFMVLLGSTILLEFVEVKSKYKLAKINIILGIGILVELAILIWTL